MREEEKKMDGMKSRHRQLQGWRGRQFGFTSLSHSSEWSVLGHCEHTAAGRQKEKSLSWVSNKGFLVFVTVI